MKVIIPLAGKGTRLRPHTYTKPKPLISVAGKPVLGHILDKLKGLNIEEIIFITGDFEEQIIDYVSKNYPYKARYLKQQELKGVAHAIYRAKDYIDKDVFIIYSDTIFEADLSIIKKSSKNNGVDGIIWVKEVEDARRFGIVFVEGKNITKLIEKSPNPLSNLAIIGLYYAKDGKTLMDSIDYIIKNDIKVKGEFYLTDALQKMIDDKKSFIPAKIKIWLDCGTVEAVIDTNKCILEKEGNNIHKSVRTENSKIIKPVYIAESVVIKNSVIGPHISIGKNSQINNSTIKESIVEESVLINDSKISYSLIGKETQVAGFSGKLNAGDSCQIIQTNEKKDIENIEKKKGKTE